jgi:hypothetical protein
MPSRLHLAVSAIAQPLDTYTAKPYKIACTQSFSLRHFSGRRTGRG